MKTISRSAVLIAFFLPLVASFYFFGSSVLHLLSQSFVFENYWTSYVTEAAFISVLSGLLSTLIAVIITFFVGYSLLSLRHHKFEKFISFFLSVPHLAFFSGLLFVISSSGLMARIGSLFFEQSTDGFDRDPWAISFSIALALKESLFLVFVSLPFIFDKKNEHELVVTKSYGHSEFTYWTFALWPRLLQFIRYPIWMIIAFSLSTVDLAMVLAPTNPPPFSVVLWEFFQSADPDSQIKSTLGSIHILAILFFVILIWELFVFLFQKLIKYRIKWPIRSRFLYFRKTILFIYLFVQLVPVIVLTLWALTDEWVFPDLLPASYTLQNFITGYQSITNQLITTIILGLISSLCATAIVLVWLEWDKLAFKKMIMIPILTVPIFPIIPLMYGFDIFLAYGLSLSPFVSVFYVHLFLIFPYVFIILKSHFLKFDERYKIISLSLGQSALRFFLSLRLRMMLNGLLAALSVGFAVSVAQYVSTLFIGDGRVETLTTQMVVASSSENRKWIGVFGLFQIVLPAIVFMITQKFGREKN